jgi:hypothetical protein
MTTVHGPHEQAGPRRARRPDPAAEQWTGPTRPYDLVKEFVVALVAVSLLTVLLAALFSSPDEQPVTLSSWANADPADFVGTAVGELDGTSGTATYGAPYNHTPDAGQKLGPLPLQRWGGVTVSVDTARDFVLGPLSGIPADPALSAALAAYSSASADQQQAWGTAYGDALENAPDNDPAQVPAGDYGPVPLLAGRLLTLARSGGLDGALQAQGAFYQTDYSKSLLFLADGAYLEDLARAQHLGGDQWGMMNETGRYPGQAWLWLYTFWYQVKPFSTSDNADALVWGLMALLTLVLVAVPFIPGLRSIPRLVPIHRLIWRQHYRQQRVAAAPPSASPPS